MSECVHVASEIGQIGKTWKDLERLYRKGLGTRIAEKNQGSNRACIGQFLILLTPRLASLLQMPSGNSLTGHKGKSFHLRAYVFSKQWLPRSDEINARKCAQCIAVSQWSTSCVRTRSGVPNLAGLGGNDMPTLKFDKSCHPAMHLRTGATVET